MKQKAVQFLARSEGLRTKAPIALLFLVAACLAARAQTTNAPPSPLDFQSFRLITDRNIFDPNRSPRSVTSGRTEGRKPAKTEAFSLVGTMSYEKGDFAFFDGTLSEYRKTLKPGDTIAGYKINAVAADRVQLELNG